MRVRIYLQDQEESTCTCWAWMSELDVQSLDRSAILKNIHQRHERDQVWRAVVKMRSTLDFFWKLDLLNHTSWKVDSYENMLCTAGKLSAETSKDAIERVSFLGTLFSKNHDSYVPNGRLSLLILLTKVLSLLSLLNMSA